MTRSRRNERSPSQTPFSRLQIGSALGVIALFSSTLAVWGALAPLGSAVVAPGILSVESNRKAVQHFEGGIIGRVLVREGDSVKRGDVVIELRDISATASVERLKSQYFEALASVARLTAERDGAGQLTFPESLMQQTADPAARGAMAAQRRIFASRRDLQTQSLAVIDRRIERYREEISGLTRQLQALKSQRDLAVQEERDAATLFEKQLVRKQRLVDAQRRVAQVDERTSALASQQAQAHQQLAEQELKKTELTSEALNTIMEEIRAQQARALQLSGEVAAAEDVLARTRVRASIDGTVVGLQVHSRDGVIRPGQTLMELVPASDDLVVEARVRPEDVQEVRAGLPATVVLNTLTRRYHQPLKGAVMLLSADRLMDPLTGRPYYLARISLDPESVTPADTRLLAGMSADVFISTGERTPLTYLLQPLSRSFHRGMREN
jgi:HlyD family type I secretion membrane fusion protein